MVKQMVDQIADAEVEKLKDAWQYEHDKVFDETYSPDWNPCTDERTLTHILTAEVLEKKYLMREQPETMEYDAIRICLRRDQNGPTVWLDTSNFILEVTWHQSTANRMVPSYVIDWIDDSYASWLGRVVKEEVGE